MSEDEKHEKKKPEFIYIEDHRVEGEFGPEAEGGYSEYFESIEKLGQAHYPWFLRMLTLLLSIGLAVWSVILALITLALAVLDLITLYKVDNFGKTGKRYRKMMSKTVVGALGCFVATFHPPFGFGIIVLYFMMLGERLSQDMMSKMTGQS